MIGWLTYVRDGTQERAVALEELAVLRERRREEQAQEAAEKVCMHGGVWIIVRM